LAASVHLAFWRRFDGSLPVKEPELSARDRKTAASEARIRVERVLAIARPLLAVASVAALYAYPGARGVHSAVPAELLGGYLVFGAAVYVVALIAPSYLLDAGFAIHLVDVLWAAAMAVLTLGSHNPFFVFLVFALIGAAARWGLTATLVTGGVTVALSSAGSLFAPLMGHGEPPLEIAHVFMQGIYSLVLTLMVGVLASQGRAYLAERDTLSRVLAGIGSASSFSDALGQYMDECLEHVGSSKALVAVEATATRRLYLWRVGRKEGGRATKPVLEDLAPAEGPIYFARPPRDMLVWHVRRWNDGTLVARGLGAGDLQASTHFDGSYAGPILERHGVSSMLAAEATVGGEWRARFMLLDPDPCSPNHLHFLRLLVAHASPALYNEYLIRRSRAHVTAIERERLARDLHDGTLQSLIGLEMELEVLRRHADLSPVREPSLRHVRDHLRRDISDVRDLMLRLQPTAMNGTDVLRVIAELANRLRREHGLDVRLVSTTSTLDCPPQTCRHLARIVQEALTNVRKHSGAQSVTITLTQGARTGRLVIEDDGRGFGFEGRLTLDQLEATDLGPAAIKKRVRAMRGSLTIESRPGAGTDLEVEFPRGAYA